jgi:SulP family sulfate permease
MIGQTMINVKASGARTRLSTFCAGLFLLLLVVVLGSVVAVIPMAALVAVMILVAWSTFDWHSVAPATLRRMPRSETLTMGLTVGGDRGHAQPGDRRRRRRPDRRRAVRPPRRASGRRHEHPRPGRVVADLLRQRRAVLRLRPRARRGLRLRGRPCARHHRPLARHIWDASAVAALDAISERYRAQGTEVEITGLNQRSDHLHSTLSGRLTPAH